MMKRPTNCCVIIGHQILNVFKIYSLYLALKHASKSGGNSVKSLMNVWEVGPMYRFAIFYNELELVHLEKGKQECLHNLWKNGSKLYQIQLRVIKNVQVEIQTACKQGSQSLNTPGS